MGSGRSAITPSAMRQCPQTKRRTTERAGGRLTSAPSRRRDSIRARWSVVLAFALMVGACSSEASTPDRDFPPAPEPTSSAPTPASIATSVSPTATASDVIASNLGGEGGAAALLTALAAGYSIDQIVTNLTDLQADGTLTGSDGVAITPAGPAVDLDIAAYVETLEAGQASGIKTLRSAQAVNPMEALFGPFFPIASAGAVKALDEEAAVHEVDPVVKEQAAVIRLVIGLASRGYTVKQIIEAVIFDEVQSFIVQGSSPGKGFQECWSVVDRQGRIHDPAGSPLTVNVPLAPVLPQCPSIDDESFFRSGRVRLDEEAADLIGVGILAATSVTNGSGASAVTIEFFVELCPDGSLDAYGTLTGGEVGSIRLRSGSWDPTTGQGSLVMINEGPEFSVDSTADLTLGDGFIELSDGTILPIVGEADCG